jgi:hypothetical protein
VAREKSDRVLSVAFHGSPERLERLKEILNRLLEDAGDSGQTPGLEVSDGWSQSGGWVREQGGWSQSGGWYLSKNDELVKVSRPDEALEQVTKSVYVALSKAEEIG